MKLFFRWLPFAVLTIGITFTMYAALEQTHRQAMNDPQVQIAEDVANYLEAGGNIQNVIPANGHIDIAQSLSPFAIIYDEKGVLVAGSGFVGSTPPTPPTGVFDYARAHGENRLTWQPQADVRIAAVVRHLKGTNGGFVLTGRSMREAEAREVRIGWMIFLGGFLMLVGTFVALILKQIFGAR